MRAYGRKGPVFRTSFRSNRGSSSSSNVEFSDDDVNSIIPDTSSTMSSSIADHPIGEFLDKDKVDEDASPGLDSNNKSEFLQLDSKGDIQDVEIITSGDTSMAFIKREKLSAFDFLDGSKASKRKKRRTYQRPDRNIASLIESSTQDEDSMMQNESESVKKIYNDINEFISNLPKADDDILKKMFENELKEVSNEEEEEEDLTRTSKERKYGKFRTMLINKNKEDEIVEEEDDQRANTIPKNDINSSNTEKEGLSSTNHYNELKNMGDTVKYQDDIEFFLSNSKSKDTGTSSIDDYFKKLLNLSLMILNDNGFFQYTKRYYKKEIIELSFARVELGFTELLLLQGYLLNKVSESQCDFPSNFEHFSIELSRNESRIGKKNKHINKISYLNFKDFLEKTKFKTGLYYSLSLWEMYGKYSVDVTKRISIVASNTDLFNQHIMRFIPLLEKLISDSKFDHTLIEHPGMLDGVINNLNNQFKNMVYNDSLIRILILLTNMERYNRRLWEGMNMVFQNSMNTVLKDIYPLTNANVDIVLLHLGLCLNICSRKECGLKIDSELWHNMKTSFLAMIRDNSEVENRLTQGLFYLIFALVINQRNKGDNLDPRELNKLLTELEAFELETSQFNEGISNKIKTALHLLKVVSKKEKNSPS